MKRLNLIILFIFIIINLLSAIEISKIDIKPYIRNQLLVSFYLEDEFPTELIQSIQSGVETILTFRIKIVKKRRFWFDKKIVDKLLTAKINYDPVTKQYKLVKMIDESVLSAIETDSDEEMEKWLREFVNINLCSLDKFISGSKYSIQIVGEIFPKYYFKIIPRNHKITFKKEFKI
ncbi:DUF4390 domain-containing protein [Candidatus Aminicenantes bacterium AC-708-M15]|jgi:hypothetical protein|nr:DUF4390 domain-containing protein [SCandidatus Aminicenantes bacterium Aminicenantia_JdfR_composite]MCP2597280.1 DUF4390 domain-containing protein [Candidatus Aminicenantes bacterium AC-335-G13]MCP2598406.1 DUF4390 domain-containing protein [Candidatus Aminicenantes bacterium AC-335-L06]MCP2604059.1 DUF4390 domain-containing protein [Candidatus Aminicenantes bacterium AC-708-M15]MCP2618310.1 DUF4390 domain-containing protein [Candidatus Aminicenantes bacterium AC-335-A11]